MKERESQSREPMKIPKKGLNGLDPDESLLSVHFAPPENSLLNEHFDEDSNQ